MSRSVAQTTPTQKLAPSDQADTGASVKPSLVAMTEAEFTLAVTEKERDAVLRLRSGLRLSTVQTECCVMLQFAEPNGQVTVIADARRSAPT
jgi:hypothetical protein